MFRDAYPPFQHLLDTYASETDKIIFVLRCSRKTT